MVKCSEWSVRLEDCCINATPFPFWVVFLDSWCLDSRYSHWFWSLNGLWGGKSWSCSCLVAHCVQQVVTKCVSLPFSDEQVVYTQMAPLVFEQWYSFWSFCLRTPPQLILRNSQDSSAGFQLYFKGCFYCLEMKVFFFLTTSSQVSRVVEVARVKRCFVNVNTKGLQKRCAPLIAFKNRKPRLGFTRNHQKEPALFWERHPLDRWGPDKLIVERWEE